jgi:hypothetical protein
MSMKIRGPALAALAALAMLSSGCASIVHGGPRKIPMSILFGGVLGMLAIDPATGAMYNLMPNKVDQTLAPQTTQVLQ